MKPTGILDSQPEPAVVTFGGTQVALKVDLSIYAIAALRRTAYKFTDRCYLFLARCEDPGWLMVTFGAKDEQQNLAPLLGEFCNELLDQQIRDDLANEAGTIRDLIVAQAFAEGNLLDPQRDEGSYQDDPLGIGEIR
jgi:His-Xaa-Ser system protein HxsD